MADAVVISGIWFGSGIPLLMYAGDVAERNGDLARRLSPQVLEVEGADHGMYVPGPLTGSIAVLSHVVVAVEEFLDAIGWPSWSRREPFGSDGVHKPEALSQHQCVVVNGEAGVAQLCAHFRAVPERFVPGPPLRHRLVSLALVEGVL